MRKLTILGASFFAALLLMAATVACGDGDGDPECVAGTACECVGDCNKTCGGDDGAGCSFSCPEGASCNFSCPGGGCDANGASAKALTLDCGGNTTCNATCGANTDTCHLTGCTASCVLTCGGASDCQSACDIMAGCTTTP